MALSPPLATWPRSSSGHVATLLLWPRGHGAPRAVTQGRAVPLHSASHSSGFIMLTSSPKGAKDLRAGRRVRPRGAAREEEPPSSPPQTPICTPPESLSLSSKLTALWKLTKWSPPFLQERGGGGGGGSREQQRRR